jgi:DNA-binding NarL/FixJ family response regulator
VKLSVAIIADDPLIRSGIAQLVAQSTGLELADEEAAEALLCDVEPARVRELVESGWIVVALASPGAARDLVDAGARAVLGRDASSAELEAATVAGVRGLFALDAAARDEVLLARFERGELPAEPLTPRELEVLALLAEGLSNRRVASRLGISENTVKFHVNALLEKLDADSRTEAVVRAARLGLVLL